MNAKDILQKPYSRRLTPDEAGGFVATIHEFPGLVAEGESADEAYRNLERAAESWLEAAIATGATVPEPMEESTFSGRVALRLPRSLHQKASEAAEADGTSLNQLLVSAVAFYLGVSDGLKKTFPQRADAVDAAPSHWGDSTSRQWFTTAYTNVGSTVAIRRLFYAVEEPHWASVGSSHQQLQYLKNWDVALIGSRPVGSNPLGIFGSEKWPNQPSTCLITKN